MKKSFYFFTAILAVLLTASCSKDVVVNNDNDLIRVRAVVNNPTKSGIVDNSHLSRMGNVYVSAAKLNDAAYYFTNNVVSSSALSAPGTQQDPGTPSAGTLTYLWPAYKLAFFAANREMTVSYNDSPVMAPYFSETVIRRGLDDPNEVMVALEAQQRDASSTPVTLNLHHALSRITVQAVSNLPGYAIEVAGVQLGGFLSQGVFTFPQYNTANGDTGADAAAKDANWEGLVSANYNSQNNLHQRWSGQTAALQYGYLNLEVVPNSDPEQYDLDGIQISGEAANIMDNKFFYILPHGVGSTSTAASGNSPTITDHYIDLLINVKTASTGVQVYPNSQSAANKFAIARAYIPTSQVFEAGKSYTITLDFTDGVGVSESGEILFMGANMYNDTGENHVDLASYVKTVAPEFPNDEFILGSAIKYFVSDVSWIPASGSLELDDEAAE